MDQAFQTLFKGKDTKCRKPSIQGARTILRHMHGDLSRDSGFLKSRLRELRLLAFFNTTREVKEMGAIISVLEHEQLKRSPLQGS